MILYLALLPGAFLSAGSAEWRISLDGSGRAGITSLNRLKDWSWALNYRLDFSGPDDMMIGINSPFLSVGLLGDAGLAAESRNPGYTSIARLDERILYRADLRSFSISRFGLSLNDRKGRLGFVIEAREDVDSVLAWGRLFSSGPVCLEILCQGAVLAPGEGSDGWYVTDSGFPGGFMLSPAARLKMEAGGWTFGASVFGSFGGLLIPGAAASLSAGWRNGPWRYRSRLVIAEPHFRTADGDGASGLTGGSMDLRFRPSIGLQLAVDISAGYSDGHIMPDECRTAFGWKRREWLAYLDMDWNMESFSPESASVQLSWNRKTSGVSLTTGMDREGNFSFYIEGEADPGTCLSLKSGFGADLPDRRTPVWKIRFRGTVRFRCGTLLLDMKMDNIPDAWRGGPDTVGAGECSIRYILSIPD